jgi:hypothetical protein
VRIKVCLAQLSERQHRGAGRLPELCYRVLPARCCPGAEESEKAVRWACHPDQVRFRGGPAALPSDDKAELRPPGAFLVVLRAAAPRRDRPADWLADIVG